MKKVLGLALVLAFVASYAQAQATATTVTNRGEVITVYTAEGGGSTGATANVSQSVPDDFTVGDDLRVTDDATVGGDIAVTGAAAVTGIATFTAESVHNGGIDADYITTDAGAGIDTKAAGALKVGAATATSVDVADSGVLTTVKGTLNVDEAVTLDSTLGITGVTTFTAAPKLTATNAVGSETATLANAPAAGNPVVWATVTVGATDYVVPLFATQ